MEILLQNELNKIIFPALFSSSQKQPAEGFCNFNLQLYYKETPTQMFSCECYEIFKSLQLWS